MAIRNLLIISTIAFRTQTHINIICRGNKNTATLQATPCHVAVKSLSNVTLSYNEFQRGTACLGYIYAARQV